MSIGAKVCILTYIYTYTSTTAHALKYFTKRWVLSLCLKTKRDSAVRTARGSSFHHLGARTEKSLDACLSCVFRDGGSSRALLELKGLFSETLFCK